MTIRLRQGNDKLSARTTTRLQGSEPGGQKRLARLKAVYKNARPRRVRGGLRILTADEVFRHDAKEEGFTDEDLARFIDHLE